MRKVVAIDGTFLKGKYEGVLLVATAQDGDLHQFPIAWGVVDKKNTYSWTWFLRRLQVEVHDDDEVVIISDRHQYIINAVEAVYKHAHHMFCVWHIAQNIKDKSNKKKGVANLFMRVSKAYKEIEFNSLYTELSNKYPEVAKYLEEYTSRERWSKAYCPRNRYNIMTTNEVESVNGRLREERELPIIVLLEAMQRIIATWFSKYRKEANASTTRLTPAIESILREHFNKSQQYEVCDASDQKYSVHGSTSNEIVDLQRKTCTYRIFGIDRIPCPHAIDTCFAANIPLYEVCSDYYSTRYWSDAYSDAVYPIQGQVSGQCMTTFWCCRHLSNPGVEEKE